MISRFFTRPIVMNKMMPADCSVLRTPTILPDRSIKVGLSSHFYAPIGAGHKAFHPPMSKLMWVQTF